ncbi:MAG: SDR family oxidoreductase [Ruthenibacterium sp.]
MQNYTEMFTLTGNIALVTGGTSGLGCAIAAAFLQNGADVAVCGGHPEKAAFLSELAQQSGRRFLALPCDITDTVQVEEMVAEISRTLGAVSLLVNSAGINKLLPAEDYDDASFAKVMNVNVNGAHLVTRTVGKQMMIPARHGHIVNLSSVKGVIGTTQNYAAYCASKGAINMYTKQIACEWGKYGITCNAIAPTFVRTPINAAQLDNAEFYDTLCKRIPLQRIGQEKDIAAAAVFLCSEGASFISGQILGVDGGLTAMQ